jgi:hypothetical protein
MMKGATAMTFFKSDRPVRQSTVWWLFAILVAMSNAAWGAVGYVHEATGDVRMQYGTATPKTVKAGDTFDAGVTFRTAADGNAIIKFEDGQIVALQPNTAFRVDGYRFNVNDPKAGNSAMSLLQGAMRYVTGVIGSTNHDNVRIAAGTATIGIRGTDITVLVDATTQVVEAAIAAGAVALQTPQGSINIGVGQFSSFSPGRPPSSPGPISAGRAALQAIVTALRAAPIPINTPVVVASAARAAAAVAVAQSAQAAAAANPGDAQLQAAAQQAAQQATAATQVAVTQAVAALQTAIQNGATAPAPPANPVISPTQTPSSPAVTPAVTPAITPTVTPPPVLCGGSPC